MATVYYYTAGQANLNAHQEAWLFWDVPGDSRYFPNCTWTVTAVPVVDPIDNFYMPEQRVEVAEMFLLRKGPDSANPGFLQLNFLVQNKGQNPVRANLIISAVGP